MGLVPFYKKNQPVEVPQNTINQSSNQTAILFINSEKYETNISVGTKIYDFMQKLQAERKINFKTKNYSGMGEFMTEINGVKNNQKNWVYYVNNKKAQIGISNYKINPGDVVSWKYESSY